MSMQMSSTTQAVVAAASTAVVTWAVAAQYFGKSKTLDDSSDSGRQQDRVRNSYAKTITKERTVGCCESTSGGLAMGYSKEELALKAESGVNLACGNPVSMANLKAGETVLDLGCGAGADCLLAAQEVGPDGHVIGVDMTPEMLKEARAAAVRHDTVGGRVSFRLGEIEYLPVANASVDVVISNCVINLSPDKQQVFRECWRCLKPGGRIAISDVIAKSAIPERLMTEESLSCCVAGAPQVPSLLKMLRDAGFVDVQVDVKEESKEYIKDWLPGSGAEEYVASAAITARKSGSPAVSKPARKPTEKTSCPPGKSC